MLSFMPGPLLAFEHGKYTKLSSFLFFMDASRWRNLVAGRFWLAVADLEQGALKPIWLENSEYRSGLALGFDLDGILRTAPYATHASPYEGWNLWES